MSDTLIVTLAILADFVILIVVAMLRFQAGTFLKFWAALGPIFGGLLGTIGTYYFQKDQVKDAEQITRELARPAAEVNQEHERQNTQLVDLESRLRAPALAARPEVAAVATELGTIQEKFQTQVFHLKTTLKGLPMKIQTPMAPTRIRG